MKAMLAGEPVDLDRIDMAERLDRELTSIVYGHSSTSLVLNPSFSNPFLIPHGALALAAI